MVAGIFSNLTPLPPTPPPLFNYFSATTACSIECPNKKYLALEMYLKIAKKLILKHCTTQ